MNGACLNVLLVEDNLADVRLVREMLADAGGGGFELDHSERLGDALHRLSQESFDVILLDLGLPDSWGPDTFIETHKESSTVPTRAPYE